MVCSENEIGILNIHYLLTIGLIMISATPYLINNYLNVLLYVIIMWVGISTLYVLADGGIIDNKHNIFVITLGWLLWVVFLFISDYSTSSIGSYFLKFVFFIYVFVMLFIEQYYSKKMKSNIAKASSIIIIVNLAHNIYLNSVYDNASTLIYTYTSTGVMYKSMNIGATDFSTMIMLFAGISMIWFLESKKFKRKLVNALIIVGSGYLIIFQHSRATASILYFFLLIFICLYNYYEKKEIPRNKILVYFVFSIMIILILSFQFLQAASSLIDNERLSSRIMALLSLVNGNSAVISLEENTLTRRIYLIVTTMKTFVSSAKNFFIGTGYNLVATDSMEEMIETTGVGYHAELIDIFGAFGLVGFGFVYNIIIRCRRFLQDIFDDNENKKYILVFDFFIIYSFLNTSFCPQLGIVVFVLLPCAPYVYEEIDRNADICIDN